MSTKKSINWRHLVNFFAYISITLIGLVLILSKVFTGNIVNALSTIAHVLSYIIVSISAFFYAKSKRNIWFLVVWIVAIVLIVVFYIIR